MDQLQKIKEYYKECDSSYQHWGEEEPYNMHYGFWDKGIHSHIDALNNMNRFLAKTAKIKDGDKILDAGCGVGASSIWLAKNYNVEVTGITISELQCEKAKIFAEKSGVSDRVNFYQQDFTKTDFSDKSFDVVWTIESVCHALNKIEFIGEAKRILKNKGRLIVADGFIKKSRLNKLDNCLLNNLLRGWKMPNLSKVDNFQKYLKEGGFKNIKFIDITKNILPSAKEIFKRGILGVPFYKLKHKSRTQMGHLKGCIFQYFALLRNIWSYGVFCAEK